MCSCAQMFVVEFHAHVQLRIVTHITILPVVTCVMNVGSQALVHFVTDRASLLTVHEMSGLPIRANHEHVKTKIVSIRRIILPLIQAPPS